MDWLGLFSYYLYGCSLSTSDLCIKLMFINCIGTLQPRTLYCISLSSLWLWKSPVKESCPLLKASKLGFLKKMKIRNSNYTENLKGIQLEEATGCEFGLKKVIAQWDKVNCQKRENFFWYWQGDSYYNHTKNGILLLSKFQNCSVYLTSAGWYQDSLSFCESSSFPSEAGCYIYSGGDFLGGSNKVFEGGHMLYCEA